MPGVKGFSSKMTTGQRKRIVTSLVSITRYAVTANLSKRLARVTGLALLLAIGINCTPAGPKTSPDDDPARRAAVDEMYSEYRSDFPQAPEITVVELLERQAQEDILLVDVREPEERAISHIPGSISKEDFEQRRNEDALPPVVAYCTIGYRSGQFVEQLQADGIDATNLKGSILAWVHAGQPVHDPEGNDTQRVHVYGKRWDLLPNDYEAVW